MSKPAHSLLSIPEMPAIAGFSPPEDIHVVVSSPALLAGMPASSASPDRLAALHAAGFRHVVCLARDLAEYDPWPLNLAGCFDLQHLRGPRLPDDPDRELSRVQAAVRTVLDKLALHEGVVVHCVGGQGRTGTVIGCALVRLGHAPERVIEYLRAIHVERGTSWPEAPWQADTVRRFGAGATR